jgi:2-C-methyl-D-erythritol 4-phosphate cytidylyltransferase
VPLAGRPLLEWSLLALARAARIGAVVVAVPAGHEPRTRHSLDRVALELPIEVIAGGPSRAESVVAAVERVESELVAVHDAARPLVDGALIDRVVGLLAGHEDASGALAATPVGDTLKRSRAEGAAAPEVAGTVDRRDLWAAQTPQAFRTRELHDAQRIAAAEGRLAAATDEAALLEAVGGRVLLEPAPSSNLKVTTAEDLALAETLLAARPRV